MDTPLAIVDQFAALKVVSIQDFGVFLDWGIKKDLFLPNRRQAFPIIEDSIWGFIIYIVGTEPGCANSYMWKIEGVAENDGGATTILTSTVTNIYRDVATKEWQVVADDPNDRMIFQFRDTAGADPTDCNIQISLFTMEVGFQAPGEKIRYRIY